MTSESMKPDSLNDSSCFGAMHGLALEDMSYEPLRESVPMPAHIKASLDTMSIDQGIMDEINLSITCKSKEHYIAKIKP